MSFKVFVTLATVLFARYSASTLPEASETLTTQQDTVEGTNNNQCPQTLNQDFGGMYNNEIHFPDLRKKLNFILTEYPFRERSEPLCTAHCLLLGHGVDTAIRKRFAFAEADKVMNNKPPYVH